MAEKGFFADRLRELRTQAGLTQKELSELSGLGISTIRQFEYGLREPVFRTLVRLTRALGVTLAAFERPEAPTPEEPKLRRRRKKK